MGPAGHSMKTFRRRVAALLVVALLATPLTLPSVAAAETDFRITGGGWGHGIGLSQWGAKGYAEHGYSYDEILSHYYQGTTLGNLATKNVSVNLEDKKDRRPVWKLRAGNEGRRLMVNGKVLPDDRIYRFVGSGESIRVVDDTTGVEVTSIGSPFTGTVRVQETDLIATGRIEDTDPAIVYGGGTWYTYESSGASGGSVKYAFTQGSYLTFNFGGTGFTWIAPKRADYGRAYVYVDTVYKGAVDLSDGASETAENQQLVWTTTGLSEGTHTVKIALAPSDDGAYRPLFVDAFDIEGAEPVAGTTEGPALIQVVDTSGPMSWAYVRYRGDMYLSSASSLVKLVNTLNIEDYLYGVVPRESPAYFPPEALKAQACAARSYAYTETASELYCTAYSQVYNGHSSGSNRSAPFMHESASTNAAVDATRGKNVMYGTTVVRTYFFSCSGGYTANIQDVWGSAAKPYYTGVPDTYETEPSGYHEWEPVSYTGSQIAQKFGYPAAVTSISLDKANTGHIKRVYMRLANGETRDVSGDNFRYKMGLKSTRFDINAPAGPLPLGRSEETAPELIYVGTWKTTTSSAASGGALAYTATAASNVSASFTGTSITWVGPKGPAYGKAYVYIDGAYKATVSQYSPGTAHQQPVYSATGLTNATHTIKIAYTGYKDSASTGTTVLVDAFDVAGPLEAPDGIVTSGKAENGDSRIDEVGSWSLYGSGGCSGGSLIYNTGSDDELIIPFKGSSFTWIGTNSPLYGQSYVYLDGALLGTADQKALVQTNQAVIFARSGLADTNHMLRIVATEGASTNFDAIVVTSPSADALGTTLKTGRTEEADGRLAYVGDWKSGTSLNASGGGFTYGTASGQTVTIPFHGTQFSWVTLVGPSYGKAEVIVDSVSRGVVDLYSPTTEVQQHVYDLGALADADHFAVIKVLGDKNAASGGTTVIVDAIDIDGHFDVPIGPLTAGRTEDADPRLAWTGTWKPYASSSASGGTLQYAYTTGAKVTATFSGTSVAWIGPKGPAYGKADVYVDGVKKTTVDLYASTIVHQKQLAWVGGLAAGTHTIEIRVLGTRNAASSGVTVLVDAIDVDVPDASAPEPLPAGTHEESEPRLEWSGTWRTATSTGASGGAFKWAYATSISASNPRMKATFSGTSVSWIAPTGPAYGRAYVLIDGVYQPEVDLYAPTLTHQQVVFSKTGLAPGTHTIEILVRGVKNIKSSGYTVIVDALAIDTVFVPIPSEPGLAEPEDSEPVTLPDSVEPTLPVAAEPPVSLEPSAPPTSEETSGAS